MSNSHQQPLLEYEDRDNIETARTNNTGSSTMQTAFNTANVIMGVSLLALPMSLKYTGWLIGITLFVSFAFIASTSAKMLAACQDFYLHSTGVPLLSYGDIGEAAFGLRGRYFIQSMFTCELFGASVALFLLITRSVYLLSGDIFTEVEIMLIIWTIMTMTTWPKSLSILAYGSMLGILCIVNLMIVIFFDGFYKREKPGSLLDPADTSILPSNWMQVPLSFGLIMAGYAGHACFPGFYASMKYPEQFGKAVNIAYGSGVLLYLAIAGSGYLMFGNQVSSVIADNLDSPDYPRVLYYITMALIIINPATKYPLTLYPIVLELEAVLFGTGAIRKISSINDFTNKEPSSPTSSPTSSPVESLGSPTGLSIDSESSPLLESENSSRPFYKHQTFRRITFRTFVSALVLITALLIPQFERVVQLLGSLFSITSSVLFPIMCYLAFFKSQLPKYVPVSDPRASVNSKWNEPIWLLQTDPDRWVYVSKWKRILALLIFAIFFVIGVVGTVWAVMPASIVPR